MKIQGDPCSYLRGKGHGHAQRQDKGQEGGEFCFGHAGFKGLVKHLVEQKVSVCVYMKLGLSVTPLVSYIQCKS